MTESRISFDLEDAGEGTRLVVEQKGFDGFKAVLVSYILQAGSRAIYDKHLPRVLEQLASGGDIEPGDPECDPHSEWRTPDVEQAMETLADLESKERDAQGQERVCAV